MARPKVPHCIECNHLEDHNENFGFLRNKYGCWYCNFHKKYISGQEVRTCPIWCHLRYRQRF